MTPVTGGERRADQRPEMARCGNVNAGPGDVPGVLSRFDGGSRGVGSRGPAVAPRQGAPSEREHAMSEKRARCSYEYCANLPVFHVGNVYAATCQQHHKYAGSWGGSFHYYDTCRHCESERKA